MISPHKSLVPALALAFASFLGMPPAAMAQTLYWDINGPAAGASNSTDAAGSWATSFNAAWGPTANWSTSPGGTSPTQLWNQWASAIFSAGSNATGTHYVTLQGLIRVNQITVNQGNVVFLRGTQGPVMGSIEASGFHIATGASLEVQAVPRQGNFDDYLKSGGGLMIWNSHPMTADKNINLLRVGGPMNLTNGLEFWPRMVEVGATENGSLDLTAGGRILANNMSTTPGQNNVILGRDSGISGSLSVGGTFTVFGWGSNMIVGLSGHGLLTINSAGFVDGLNSSTRMIVAANPGSSGEVIINSGGELRVTGPESLVQGAGSANLRLAGGRLRVEPDQFARPFSGNVPVTLSGVSTISMNGNSTYSGPISGSGSLLWQGGGMTCSGNQSYTGSTTIQNSQVQIVGGSARLVGTASLDVGTTGSSSLSVSNGGLVHPTGYVRLGATAAGNATVSGLGSELIAGTFLEIGNGAASSLDIRSGGRVVSTATSALGVLPSSLGTVNVEGFGGAITPVGSSWDIGTALLVGYQSTGIVNIENGGIVTVGGHIELGSFAGGSGVLELETGGTLRVGGANGIRLGTGIGGIALKGGTLKPHLSSLSTTVPMGLTNISTLETGPFSITLGGALTGTGGLWVKGSQPVFLTAANAYSGGTTVSGKLVVPAGHALGNGAVEVVQGELESTGSFSREQNVTVSNRGKLTAANFMEFGANGTGALAVSGGGQVSAAGTIALGVVPGAVGQADVVGVFAGAITTESSTLASGSHLYIGYLGTGGVTVGSGGTVTVGGQMILGSEPGGSGTFRLNPGGTLNVGGTNGIVKGSGAATFDLAGGLLKVISSSLTTSAPITLSATTSVDTSGVDADLGGVMTGAGGLVKFGAGTLSLTAANHLTGSLTNWAGNVRAATPSSLPSGAVALNGGTLHLDFAGTATVQSLGFDGLAQTGGLWGAVRSAAPNQSARITGTGLLNVLSSTFPPAFNPQTQAGLKHMIGGGLVDLFAATGVAPLGGTFSGPGVSGGSFDPTAAGYGMHTILYTVGGQSASFTIAVIGGVVLEEEGGAQAPGNLAASATAFAKDVLNHPNHGIAGLNDGAFGNAGSWIGDSEGSFAGIAFGVPQTISRIAFGRDNTRTFLDRAEGFYAIQFTIDANPAAPGAVWTTIGAVDYRTGGTAGVQVPSARHLYRFSPVTATGIRILPGFASAAIDEIEVYPASGLFVLGPMTLMQEGGTLAAGNLAPAGVAFSLNEIGVAPHATAKVNDGIFGNDSSWIGGTDTTFVGVNLGNMRSVNRIAFGRDQTGSSTDRKFGRYTLQYTTVPNPGAGTPAEQWTRIGMLDYQSAGGALFSTPSARHLYGFPAVNATGLRLVIEATAGLVAIDEMEIYLGSPTLELTHGAAVAVADGGTVYMGGAFVTQSTAKTFTVSNTGTDALDLGTIGISGSSAAQFVASTPGATQLAPGQSTTFTITFTPLGTGLQNATVQLAGGSFDFEITGNGLPPTFNAATVTGLSFAAGSGAVDLATVTGAMPAGGEFTGAGVSSGQFHPSSLKFGNYWLTYSVNGSSSTFMVSVVGGLTSVEVGGTFAPANRAPMATAFAQNEIGVAPHTIGGLNDGIYGNASSWIAGTPVSFAGLDFSAAPVYVDRVAFGRDNLNAFLDRGRGIYLLQYTTVSQPTTAAETSWVDIGAVDTRTVGDPHLRRLYSFPAVAATGLRLVVAAASDYIAIDEWEVYGPPGTPSPVDLWRQRVFGTPFNAGLAADLSDFDQDGVTNLVEYAFALDPTNAGDFQIPLATRNNGALELRFTPPAEASGVTYGSEWSTTLEPGSWQPVTNSGAHPELLFRVPMGTHSRLFMRHVITAP